MEGEFLAADLTDYGQVVEAVSGGVDEHAGVDAIVHLPVLRVGALMAWTMSPNLPPRRGARSR